MESSKVISTDKATVIIQINPRVAQDAVICHNGQETGGAYLTEFVRAQPKALGTVQIMTGVMIFLFGIVRTSHYAYGYGYNAISVITGITYWGSLIYISAGSLSVSAQNKLHPCAVKAALIMNVISAITAAAAIVLMSTEIKLLSERIECDGYDSMCSTFKRHDLGIVGILLVFSVLQFIISVCISAPTLQWETESHGGDPTV